LPDKHRAYDADRIRAAQAEWGGWANVPPKRNRVISPIVFSPLLYKQRNLIERFFNRIKHFRRIATRSDKLAATFLAALKLVAVRIWLRHYESTT
jgi:transposase